MIIETKTKNTFPSFSSKPKSHADDSLSATKFYLHRIIVPTVFMIRDHALAFLAAWLLSGSKIMAAFESEEVINMDEEIEKRNEDNILHSGY